ncbi:universal stress protein [Spirillospora albida]|uniref:universal stress protein n=1 Tax=Spirillospora albida TaxID=58123 RepID=UPI0004BE50B5|nr:universal stress protein [Spirillospora albida]
MPAPIVVGIDGSAHAWRALDWAAEHAVRHRLPLLLVHGSRALLPDGSVPEDALRHLVAEREDMLAEACRYALKTHPGLDVTTRLVPHDPRRALEEESGRASLVAVGSRGLGGFAGLLLGSVGVHTVVHARCPVLVVSRAARYPADAPARIVVGIEGRHDENAVLDWAFTEAASSGAGIVALHAVGAEFGTPRVRVTEDMELSEALAGFGERFPEVPVVRDISDRPPAQALVDASEDAALVVVGAHRGHGPAGMALGRLGHAVLRHAHCPVVVVPRGGAEE